MPGLSRHREDNFQFIKKRSDPIKIQGKNSHAFLYCLPKPISFIHMDWYWLEKSYSYRCVKRPGSRREITWTMLFPSWDLRPFRFGRKTQNKERGLSGWLSFVSNKFALSFGQEGGFSFKSRFICCSKDVHRRSGIIQHQSIFYLQESFEHLPSGDR